MPTDPSIILGINPAPNSAQQTMTLADFAQNYKANQAKLAMQQRQLASESAIKGVLSDPANLDPATGRPTTKALREITQIDPQVGMGMQEHIAGLEEKEAQAGHFKSQAFKEKVEAAHDVNGSAIMAYDEALKAGTPIEAAVKAAQKVYDDGMTGLEGSGLYSQNEIDNMPKAFDPVKARANSMTVKDWLAQQKVDAAETDKAKTETERERHDRATEAQGERRTKVAEEGANASPPLDDEGIDYAATKYRETGTMPPMGMGKAAAGVRAKIIQRAAQMAKDTGGGAAGDVALAADTKATTAGLVNLGKMKASVQQAEGNAGKEADLVLSLTDKGAAGATPVFNKWIQGARTGVFGDPDSSKFQTAVESFKNEYVKVLSTTGGMSGGMSSDAARREADAYINPNLTKAQIKANIGVMRRSMANRTAAINDAYESSMHKLEHPDGGGTHGLPQKLSDQYGQITDPAKRAEAKRRLAGAGYDVSGL